MQPSHGGSAFKVARLRDGSLDKVRQSLRGMCVGVKDRS